MKVWFSQSEGYGEGHVKVKSVEPRRVSSIRVSSMSIQHRVPSTASSLSGTFVTERGINLSLPRCHLKTTSKRVKFQILKRFCLFVCSIVLASKRTELKVDLLQDLEERLRVRTLFSPEILQAWTVKGFTDKN